MADTESHLAAFADPRATDIIAIVAKETGIVADKLTPDAKLADLGVASIDMVQSIFEIETKYNIELPMVAEQGEGEFETVGALVAHVLQTLDTKAAKTAAAEQPKG